MAATNSLARAQRKIKKKPQGGLHPKGRKYEQLMRAALREDKLSVRTGERQERRQNEQSRVKFMRDLLNRAEFKEVRSVEPETAREWIKIFIARDDEEIKKLQSQRRANRPPTNRQLLLQHKRDAEMSEFETGFLCPDLGDDTNVEYLRLWNGTTGGMSALKMTRYLKNGTDKEIEMK